jgi:hypothetical protein
MAGWVTAVVVVIVAAFNFFIYLGNENNVLFKACRKGDRKAALLVSNRKEGVQGTVRPISFWAWDLIDPQDLVSATLSPGFQRSVYAETRAPRLC